MEDGQLETGWWSRSAESDERGVEWKVGAPNGPPARRNGADLSTEHRSLSLCVRVSLAPLRAFGAKKRDGPWHHQPTSSRRCASISTPPQRRRQRSIAAAPIRPLPSPPPSPSVFRRLKARCASWAQMLPIPFFPPSPHPQHRINNNIPSNVYWLLKGALGRGGNCVYFFSQFLVAFYR